MTYTLTIELHVTGNSGAGNTLGTPLHIELQAPGMSQASFGLHVLFLDSHLTDPTLTVNGAAVGPLVSRYHQSDETPDRCGLSRWFRQLPKLSADTTVVVKHGYKLSEKRIDDSPEVWLVPFTLMTATNPELGDAAVHTGAAVPIKEVHAYYDLR